MNTRLSTSLLLLASLLVASCSDSSSRDPGTAEPSASPGRASRPEGGAAPVAAAPDAGPHGGSDGGPGWVRFLLDDPAVRWQSPLLETRPLEALRVEVDALPQVAEARTCAPGGVEGAYRLRELPFAFHRDAANPASGESKVALLDAAGRPLEAPAFALAGRHEARCTSLAVFPDNDEAEAEGRRTYRHVRDHLGDTRVLIQRPEEVKLPVDTLGLPSRLRLNFTPGPGGKNAELPEDLPGRPSVSAWSGEQALGSIEMRPRGTTTLEVAVPPETQEVRLRFENLRRGSGATTMLLETLVFETGSGADLLLVPVAVSEAIAVIPPAVPAAMQKLARASRERQELRTVLAPGRVTLLGMIPTGARASLDGQVVATAAAAATELSFTVDATAFRRIVLEAPAPVEGDLWLVQPAALFTEDPSVVRGREGPVTEPRTAHERLVRHVMIEDETRRSLLTSAPSRVEFDLAPGTGGTLEFSHAVTDLVKGRAPMAAVQLDVRLERDGAAPQTLYQQTFRGPDPWRDVRIELPAFEGAATLVLQTSAAAGAPAAAACRSLLALCEPRLVRARERRPPNLLIYLIDTLRADHVGCYGYARPTTPNIDRLAQQGIVFENAYSQAPWTRPSVATLFTSLYYSFHGAGKVTGLDGGLTTLAERAHAAGYDTGAFIANAHVHGPGLNFEQGFTESVGVEKRRGQSTAADVNELVFPWLERHQDRPFFLYVHTIDPHATYDPPADVAGTFNQGYEGSLTPDDTHSRPLGSRELDARDVQYLLDLYDEEILFNDLHFGELVRRLQELGLYDDTMIVVTSDHGEEFHEHGGFGHGNRLWEELIRVPLVVKMPGAGPRDVRVEETVGLLDVLPTVAGPLGFGGDGTDLQGLDLAPFAAGDLPDSPRELLSEEEPSHRALIKGDVKVIEWFSDDPARYRLELYDLGADPGEQQNLAAVKPELAEQWRLRLLGTILSLEQRFRRWEGLPEGTRTPEMLKALIELGYLDGAGVDLN